MDVLEYSDITSENRGCMVSANVNKRKTKSNGTHFVDKSHWHFCGAAIIAYLAWCHFIVADAENIEIFHYSSIKFHNVL